ncbi:MAG: hypothetical protein IJ150_10260 [Bacteroidales bacterium]|nr:hypothetical protein [Bacteroidales bacterium]
MKKSDLLQSRLFNRKTDGFEISNPLLNACMGYSCPFVKNNDFNGFRKSKNSIGYIVLCALLEDALNIKRYPYTADRVITDLSKNICDSLIIHLPIIEQYWDNAVKELNLLHQYTKQKLFEQFSDEPLFLKRVVYDNYKKKINPLYYVENLQKICNAAKILNHSVITFEMDTLNSYMSVADNGYTSGYAKHAIITHQINIDDILYCYSLVSPKTDIEENEWVVINRSRDGIVHLPIESFEFLEKNEQYSKMSIEQAQDIWQNQILPIYIRPEVNIRNANYIGNVLPKTTEEPMTLMQKIISYLAKHYFDLEKTVTVSRFF